MFGLKNKRNKICVIGAFVCCAIFLIVFYLTDGMTGDKEFSQYTRADWSIALPGLIIMGISAVASLTFSFIIIIPVLIAYPAITDYVTNKKLSEIDANTEFIIFDFDELKRACCHLNSENEVWFSAKEYNLKKRSWTVLEEGRCVKNYDALIKTLQEDYKFDQIKWYNYNQNPIKYN